MPVGRGVTLVRVVPLHPHDTYNIGQNDQAVAQVYPSEGVQSIINSKRAGVELNAVVDYSNRDQR